MVKTKEQSKKLKKSNKSARRMVYLNPGGLEGASK